MYGTTDFRTVYLSGTELRKIGRFRALSAHDLYAGYHSDKSTKD
jgi:hypothetical protein